MSEFEKAMCFKDMILHCEDLEAFDRRRACILITGPSIFLQNLIYQMRKASWNRKTII